MTVKKEETAIEVHDLTVSYNQKPVLWNIDFSMPKGRLVGILGPNGAGKSTLLKTIMQIIKPDSGYVKIFNEDIDAVREKISYVPQRESVDWDFPASALDVVLMGRFAKRGLFKRFNKADKEIAYNALELVKMERYANRQIAQLSGGQQQRVFLARSLAQEADLYLMDEPFAGVDATTEAAILNLLTEMRTQGKTLFVVHHDLQSAYEYFDSIVLLNKRLVVADDKETAFTDENLRAAYGGQLTLLSTLSNTIAQKGIIIKE